MQSSSLTDVAAPLPLACIPEAIPAAERGAHLERAKSLFGEGSLEKRALPDGYAFRFDAGAVDELMRWVTYERLCCPFLSFTLELSPGEGPVWVRMAGPEGTRAFLDAELPAPDRVARVSRAPRGARSPIGHAAAPAAPGLQARS